ncbi:hypothetical protein BD410DRAFT_894962 [Rickenella mellea]|uniref:MYND-type domain-containing protein n=1 Tax=Rickenella mellea TaxID=50990 RepID=A0A4Y7QI04_9AGAM|nr:hypothetical protein BD410DRAFT_894962 [Rickenella mellea]
MMSDTADSKSAACSQTAVQSQYSLSGACDNNFGLPAHLVVNDTGSAAGSAVFTTDQSLSVLRYHTRCHTPSESLSRIESGFALICLAPSADVTAAANATAKATQTANVNAHRGFFISHCSACDQAFYCSASCLRFDARKHALACGALKKLRGWAKDRHVASVPKLIILVLAERKWGIISNSGSGPRSEPSSAAVRRRDNVGDPAGVITEDEVDCGDNEADKIRLTYLKRLGYSFGHDLNLEEGQSEDDKEGDEDCIARRTFQDVMALQSHVASWPVEDARDWEQHASFTMSLFDRSPDHFPDQWTFEDLLNLASRIESTGFGCFSEDMKVEDMCGGEMRNGLRSLQPADHLHLDVDLGDNDNPSPVNTRKPSSSICFARGEPAPGSASVEVDESRTLRQSQEPRGGRAHTSCQVTQACATRTEIAPKFEMVGWMLPEPGPGPARALALMVNRFSGRRFFHPGREVSIGLQQPRSARRSALLSEYYFECGCARCVREEGEKAAGGKREKEGKGQDEGEAGCQAESRS